MHLCAVLDDGQAETCAADLLGMALVHTVKALENPLLFFPCDADTGVGDGNGCFAVLRLHAERDSSSVPVIFNGVIRQIVEHFLHHGKDAPDLGMAAGERQRDIPLFCLRLQAFKDIGGHIIEVDILFVGEALFLIELAQAHDVVYKCDHSPGFPINISGKFRDLVLRHKAVPHELGKAGNGRQRRFQLVGHVRGELLAQAFSSFALLPDRLFLFLNAVYQG